ncbi:MAG: nucleotidyltransferase domain-containing protein [Gammaproteobacteria bacterium]|nr:nucleotidyltransferase domain-containing protein [Gammaproteobacteria bacterium]
MINIKAKDLQTIKTILKHFIPNTPVWVFGSRITAHAKPYSDLDMVIKGKDLIPQQVYYQIKDALEESDLPFRVDVLDWHRISPAFQNIIQAHHEALVI